jgi:hypothetical protein
MKTKLLIIAGLALAISAPLASAQEDWGEERMRELRADCANGDDRACERLGHMRREHEEREHGERERGERERGERRGDAPPPVADPKVALCAAIENNYNNCLRHQHDGCPAWVVELKANHCF